MDEVTVTKVNRLALKVLYEYQPVKSTSLHYAIDISNIKFASPALIK
jgi:hypothetical protein